MYICAFNFDINWFTTLPGMLISGGVVLLLVALLLFATSGKKNKAKKEEVVATNVAPNFTDPSMNANVGMDPMMNQNFSNDPSLGIQTQFEQTPVVPSNTVDPFMGNMQSVSETPMDTVNVNPVQIDPVNSSINVVNMEPVQPVSVEPTPADVNTMNQEINAFNAMPENNDGTSMTTDSSTMPNISPVDLTMPGVDPIASSMTDNVVVPEVSQAAPVVEENNIPTPTFASSVPIDNTIGNQAEGSEVVIPSVESATAYGGVSPAVDLPKEESSHQIYGGANPLDKTQTIPIINNPVEQNSIEEKQEPMEKTTEIPVVNTNSVPAYQEAKLVEDKDIEVLDF